MRYRERTLPSLPEHVYMTMVPILIVVFALVSAGTDVLAAADDVESCMELSKPVNIKRKCCLDVEKYDKEEEDKDCFEKGEKNEWTCEKSECMLKKGDIMSSDGKINENKFTEKLAKIEENEPDLKAMTERVRKNCLEEAYLDYPPVDVCPAIKFQFCVIVNSIVECKSWKTDDECKKYADNANKCKAVLDGLASE